MGMFDPSKIRDLEFKIFKYFLFKHLFAFALYFVVFIIILIKREQKNKISASPIVDAT